MKNSDSEYYWVFLYQCCDQVHDIPATLLVSVDASPLPDGIAVKALAETVAKLLESTGKCLNLHCVIFVKVKTLNLHKFCLCLFRASGLSMPS